VTASSAAQLAVPPDASSMRENIHSSMQVRIFIAVPFINATVIVQLSAYSTIYAIS
jgi:hypothetical protein